MQEPRVGEDGQVRGSRGRGQPKQLGNLADAQLPVLQGQQHADAVLVPQRLGQGHKLTKLHTSYFDIQRNIIPSVLPMSSGWRKWLQKWLSDGALYVNGNIGNADRKSTRLNSSHRCISYA